MKDKTYGHQWYRLITPIFLHLGKFDLVKGAVSRNSAKLGNYKMPVKLRET